MINDGRRDPIVSIEHIALATQDVERLVDFYQRHCSSTPSSPSFSGTTSRCGRRQTWRHFLSAGGDAGTVPGVVGRPYRDVRERVPPMFVEPVLVCDAARHPEIDSLDYVTVAEALAELVGLDHE